jgi:hypothetical protein
MAPQENTATLSLGSTAATAMIDGELANHRMRVAMAVGLRWRLDKEVAIT